MPTRHAKHGREITHIKRWSVYHTTICVGRFGTDHGVEHAGTTGYTFIRHGLGAEVGGGAESPHSRHNWWALKLITVFTRICHMRILIQMNHGYGIQFCLKPNLPINAFILQAVSPSGFPQEGACIFVLLEFFEGIFLLKYTVAYYWDYIKYKVLFVDCLLSGWVHSCWCQMTSW